MGYEIISQNPSKVDYHGIHKARDSVISWNYGFVNRMCSRIAEKIQSEDGLPIVEGCFVLVPDFQAIGHYWNEKMSSNLYVDASSEQFNSLFEMLISGKNIKYPFIENSRRYLKDNKLLDDFRRELQHYFGAHVRFPQINIFEKDSDFSKRFYCLYEDAEIYVRQTEEEIDRSSHL